MQEQPAGLEDPRTLATGAVVAMLLEHRSGWVRRHVERIELREAKLARRRVDVDFELPGIAWAGSPNGTPTVVPLAFVDEETAAGAEVRDEDGAPVALLPAAWSAEIAAAGLLAIAHGVGGSAGPELRGLAWRIAGGSPAAARGALRELSRSDSAELRRAWAHEPFREFAKRLAGRRMLLVALPKADVPRVLTYAYDERPQAGGGPKPSTGAFARASRRLGWDGLQLRFPLPHLGDARRHEVEVEAPDGVDVSTAVDEERRTADISVRPRGAVLWLAPLAALVGAAVLTAAWLAVPSIGDGRGLLALAVVLPVGLAIHAARDGEHRLLGPLLRGVRTLLLVVGGVSLVSAVAIAAGAPTAALRVTVGLAAALAWVVAALLLETRRRALGAPARALEPHPRPDADADGEPAGGRLDATRIALLACAMAAGLFVVALAYDAARDGRAGADALLWAGLAAIFIPAVVHAWRAPPRTEAVIGVVMLGVALYLVKVLHAPLDFVQHDEFSTLRTTLDIERFGHPFEDNPLIGVHPFYPGLELVTEALSSVTGLSTFVSAMVVIGVLRVALMAGLFMLVESVSSTRVAALATVLYVANPNFLFFDSQWAYESFALPLAFVAVALVARGPRTAWLSVPLILTLSVSHPLTSLAVVAFLVVWAVVDARVARRTRGTQRREIRVVAAIGGVFLLCWTVFVARNVGGYLGPVLADAGGSLVDVLLGQSGPKRIFGASGAGDTPVAERVLGFAAVGLALAAIGFGLRPLWRRFTPLGGTLAAAALLYPITLPLRLTDEGTEIAGRASEFVFVGIAFLGALALTEARPAALARVAARAPRLAVPAVVALAAILFAGGIVIGSGRTARMPGDYLVASDSRSVEPEGRLAARWSRDRLGTGNRIVTDRTNGLLWGSIGLQEPQTGDILGRSVPGVILAPVVDEDVRYALVRDDLRYTVVDRRLASGLPGLRFYFEPDEPGAFDHKRPPSLQTLTKFDSVCPVGRAFDSGQLVVYDTRRMSEEIECYGGDAAAPSSPGVPGPGGRPRGQRRGSQPYPVEGVP